MTKQEEIREGIAKLCASGMRDCDYECKTCQDLNRVLKGVVVKVERELPNPPYIVTATSNETSINDGFRMGRDGMLKAGYELVVPLIKEVTNGT